MPAKKVLVLKKDSQKLDPILLVAVVFLIVFLAVFIAYPLFVLLINSVFDKGAVSFEPFSRVFKQASFRGVITNTLKLGLISGAISTAIGFLFAYVDCYVQTRLKGLFNVISVLPIVSPPFVLSLSCIMLFGRSGLITRRLLGIIGANIYGMHGIIIVQSLTFFPVCYLILRSLLKNIDPSLEESAQSMGASRWKIFWTVTFPLLLPGIGNAFLVTFIDVVADFTNPMMIGGDYSTLATSIYLQIIGSYDVTGASVMAIVLLLLTMSLFVIQKYLLEKKTVTTLSGKASRERALIKDKSVTIPLSIICSCITVFVISLYILVPFGALFKLWGKDFTLVTTHFKYVFNLGLKPFKDSLTLSLISAPVTALLSIMIAYLVVKKTFFGKRFIEFVSLFAMAVPGTVIGIGFLRGYIQGIFGTGILAITGTGTIIVLAYVVRSLPVGTRSGISALQQIDKSIEESAYDLGANTGKVFTSITLPLIKDSFFSGLVTTFVRSMTATSAVIFLVSPGFQLITPQIMAQADVGRFGVACAYSTLLILIVYGSILIMNVFLKYFGVSHAVGEVD